MIHFNQPIATPRPTAARRAVLFFAGFVVSSLVTGAAFAGYTALGGGLPGDGGTSVSLPSGTADPSASAGATPSPLATAPSPAPDPTPSDPVAAANIARFGTGKVIVVSIADQALEALADGVVARTSPVATGRPSLPTPTGTFRIQNRYSPYTMYSPWPKGDPYYYPPSRMNYAMPFDEAGGYFIHDAPWRTVYGPGANTQGRGTHGCVNVPTPAAGWLFRWAEVGTTVVIVDGRL